MASISELNIRLGIQYQALDKGLEKVERRLLRSGRRLSQLGDQWSLAVSLPLAAAGAAAVRSAAKIESLELALQSQLGSAAAARKELELLRKEAEKPGLGLEQAVRGSVSLQAVGFAAAESRTILSEFGNALALAGKGAQELDGVVLALTQIRAKGVVSAEEINQIAERLPQIRTLMQQAFGTASTEAIQKLGITSEQFINSITKELKTLPRAAGGIRNSLDNFFDAITLGASKFGKAISTAVDLPGKLQDLATFVSGVADSFSSLDPEVQKFAVYAGLAVVAAGPLAKVLGAVQTAGAQSIGVLQSLLGGLRSVTGVVLDASRSFDRLKLSLGVIGLVVGIGAAVYALSQRFDAAKYAADQFADAQKTIINQTSQEIAKINQSFDALKREGQSRLEKGRIIDELIKQYPSYLRGINLETASVEELTRVQKGLNEQILRGVAERQKAQAVNNLYEKQAQILLRIQQLREGADQTVSEATLVNTGDVLRAGGIAEAVIVKLQQQADELGRQVTVTAGQFDRAFGTMARSIDPALEAEYAARDAYYASREAVEATATTNAKALENAKKRAELYREVISDIANVSARQDLLGSEKIVEQASAIEKGINRLLDAGFKPASREVQGLKDQLEGLFNSVKVPELPEIPTLPTRQDIPQLGALGGATDVSPVRAALDAAVQAVKPGTSPFEEFTAGAISFDEAFSKLSENIVENGSVMQTALLSIADAATAFAQSGNASIGGFVNSLVDGAKKAVGAYIRIGVASIVAKSLTRAALNPFAALALGGIAGAAAQALFNRLLSSVKIPAFARGTNYAPGGLALVGEKGPELLNMRQGSQVIPNNKLDGLIGNNKVQVGGVFRIVGSDLLVVLEEAQRQSGRIRGF